MEMLLAEYNDMIKAVPPDRTDQPLRITVLPGRLRRDRAIPYAHCRNAPDEGFPVSAIPITNKISRRFLPAISLAQLPGDPFGGRMCGHS